MTLQLTFILVVAFGVFFTTLLGLNDKLYKRDIVVVGRVIVDSTLIPFLMGLFYGMLICMFVVTAINNHQLGEESHGLFAKSYSQDKPSP